MALRYFDAFYNARENEALPPYSAHVRATAGVRCAARGARRSRERMDRVSEHGRVLLAPLMEQLA